MYNVHVDEGFLCRLVGIRMVGMRMLPMPAPRTQAAAAKAKAEEEERLAREVPLPPPPAAYPFIAPPRIFTTPPPTHSLPL